MKALKMDLESRIQALTDKLHLSEARGTKLDSANQTLQRERAQLEGEVAAIKAKVEEYEPIVRRVREQAAEEDKLLCEWQDVDGEEGRMCISLDLI